MPANRHTRHDITLTIRLADDEVELQLDSQTLRIARQLLADQNALTDALTAWPPLRRAATATRTGIELHRLVLRIRDLECEDADWESALAAASRNRCALVVRVTDVHPRVMQRLFEFPARVLALGREHRVEQTIADLLRSRSEYAMVVKRASLTRSEKEIERAEWPLVDILHFQSGAEQLSTRTDPEDVGSLRWLLRRCERWRTRLIVLESSPNELPPLRRIAHTVVARGGPAVFVFERSSFDAFRFYADLLHDRPLDWIQAHLGGALFAGAGREEAIRFSAVARYLTDTRVVDALVNLARQRSLSTRRRRRSRTLWPTRRIVINAVRESAKSVGLKVEKTQIAQWEHPAKYIRFGDVIASRMLDHGYAVPVLDSTLDHLRGTAFTVTDVADLVMPRAMRLDDALQSRTPARFEQLVADRLTNVRESSDALRFDESEGEGTLPLAAKSMMLRKLVGADEVRVPQTSPERHVNTRFYRTGKDDELVEIRQAGARFQPGKLVHLGIRIGEKDMLLENIGDLVFADESIPWTPDMTGTWIEVALTPIDFENVGEPVQEFWLPRSGDAPLITFAVRPRMKTTIPGVARLRFTFYHRNNVLQSFRVVVRIAGVNATRAAMTAALGIEAEKSSAGYLTRLEYAAADADGAASLPERTLSIVANESAGEKIFSIKTENFFSTSVNANLGERVKNVRTALLDASRNTNGEYRYDDNNQGEGDDKTLLDRLWSLAKDGWALYFSVLPDEEEQKRAARLLGSGGTITAAHIDLRQLVTWSLMYDRLIDENHTEHHDKKTNTDTPVDRAVCRAGFPDASGAMPPGDCITDPKCILSEAAVAARIQKTGRMVCPETVVCPRRFWGFQHQIEVPAQQAEQGKAPKPLAQVVKAAQPAGILAGFNPTLRYLDPAERPGRPTHLADFTAAVTNAGATLLGALQKRNALVAYFNDEDPDVIYLYCHAWPETKQAPNKRDPNLDFGRRGVGETIAVYELAGKRWTHAPLVFLNACGAAGFRDDAPSEFITAFVNARHAAAVVGTEVTVWEQLATEMALNVLSDFLKQIPAGEALLRARRVLLAKYNPLGLVYTLYGSASLHLP